MIADVSGREVARSFSGNIYDAQREAEPPANAFGVASNVAFTEG
jgi:hypothetical protein